MTKNNARAIIGIAALAAVVGSIVLAFYKVDAWPWLAVVGLLLAFSALEGN